MNIKDSEQIIVDKFWNIIDILDCNSDVQIINIEEKKTLFISKINKKDVSLMYQLFWSFGAEMETSVLGKILDNGKSIDDENSFDVCNEIIFRGLNFYKNILDNPANVINLKNYTTGLEKIFITEKEFKILTKDKADSVENRVWDLVDLIHWNSEKNDCDVESKLKILKKEIKKTEMSDISECLLELRIGLEEILQDKDWVEDIASGDDDFMDFCGEIIARGKSAYYEIIKKPVLAKRIKHEEGFWSCWHLESVYLKD